MVSQGQQSPMAWIFDDEKKNQAKEDDRVCLKFNSSPDIKWCAKKKTNKDFIRIEN